MAATAAKRVEAGARSGTTARGRLEPQGVPQAAPPAVPEPSTQAAPPASSLEADKRRQILEGARRVFLSAGFDGASMGEIARAAGVSKGTLYVYFDSKEALFEALTIEERCGLAEALFQLDADDPDVRGVLRRLGLSFIDHLARPDHVASVRMVIGAGDKFPRFGQAFYEAGPMQGIARVSAYLDAQVAAGRLAPGHDTEVAAGHFLDMCGSRILKRLLFSVPGAPGLADREEAVEAALRVFFAAYGAAGAAA